MHVRPTTRALCAGVALILAVLVFLGLVSSGLAPIEHVGAPPLASPDVRMASAPARAGAVPTVEVPARRIVTAATSLGLGPPPLAAMQGPAARDIDIRRNRLRLGIEIRGPPTGRFA